MENLNKKEVLKHLRIADRLELIKLIESGETKEEIIMRFKRELKELGYIDVDNFHIKRKLY